MSTRKSNLFYGALIAVASTAIGMVLASRLDLTPASSAQAALPAMNSAPITGALEAGTFRTIAKTASPIVVNIRAVSKHKAPQMTEFFGGGDELFNRFFGGPNGRGGSREPREETTQAAGTGFIIDKSGYILTNNHVVENATQIKVAIYGDDPGTEYDAKIVGRDPLTDSALIEMTEKPDRVLPEAKFGDSSQVQPGDWVMAIGNPFNFAHTVTVGVVSAVERPYPVGDSRYQQVIQTDAAINPGNSGGPLLNLRGEVVGINTAIISGDRGPSNVGIGFAMPINLVRDLLPQLREGKITRGRIGVQITPVSANLVQDLGLKDRKGALVRTVERDGPAKKAGLEPGDVITEYNGKPVPTSDELVRMVMATRPGTTVPLKIMRDGTGKSISVTVEELNLEEDPTTSARRERDSDDLETTSTGFGMTVSNLSAEIARQLRVPDSRGALVTDVDPNSPAAQGGLSRGDVILKVNRRDVATAADAVRELKTVQAGRNAFLLVWRRPGQEVFVTLRKE